ncbi:MAG TPA: hypothetical protein VF763_05320 [Candidatus Limnocylindrales bacterium]
MTSITVYLEVGTRRVFAAALDWPGWCRGGRDEPAALAALVAYAPRYAAALGTAAGGLALPRNVAALEVVERIPGDATTDFGAPGAVPPSDGRPLEDGEAARLATLLAAAWAAFDASAAASVGRELRTGPRGGGRSVDAMVDHVRGAEEAYLHRLGGRAAGDATADPGEAMARIRAAFSETLAARVRGDEPPPGRRRAPLWPPRYAVRRSAWHALDHAWELEDRRLPADG